MHFFQAGWRDSGSKRSDGAQFTSALWAALCNMLAITHAQTTAYHPQSNGLVERFHRRLKDALRARCAAANWTDHLPWLLLGLRSAAREDDNTTPAQAVFGSQLILPGQFLDSPENDSNEFFTQLSTTLSAAEICHTRHNTTPARRPPPQLPDALSRAPTAPTPSSGGPCTTSPCRSETKRTRCPPSG